MWKDMTGNDMIPQKIKKDGCSHLAYPYYILMNKIFNQREIPEQWRESKIVIIHNKGDKYTIDNYRPISILCSMSKVFEKLIMLWIEQMQQTQTWT
jgi:hypothetical protein